MLTCYSLLTNYCLLFPALSSLLTFYSSLIISCLLPTACYSLLLITLHLPFLTFHWGLLITPQRAWDGFRFLKVEGSYILVDLTFRLTQYYRERKLVYQKPRKPMIIDHWHVYLRTSRFAPKSEKTPPCVYMNMNVLRCMTCLEW